MRARIWIPLVVLGVLIVGFLVIRLRPEAVEAVERTATVAAGPIEVWVTGTGKVEPAAQAAMFFQVAGTLGDLNAQVGQTVSAGDVLAALDPASLDPTLIAGEADLVSATQTLDELLEGPTEQLITQAEMAVAQARDKLRVAEYTWNNRQEGQRASSDTVRGAEARLVLAQEEVDQAAAEYNALSGRPSDDPGKALALTKLVAARQDRDSALRNLNWYTGRPTEIQQAILDSEVAVAMANLAQAEQDLADLRAGPDPDAVEAAEARVRAVRAVVDQARLISPIDGTVMSVNHSPGDSVVPGEVEIVVADLAALHVDTAVDELDIRSIEMGQEVEITLDALPGIVLSGAVAGIDLTPGVATTSTQYPVQVELGSVDDLVRVGMTAALSIQVAEEEAALLVPNWALGFDPETGEVIVFVVDGQARDRRPIVLGLRNDSFSQVVSGLEAGEIISASLDEERPGGGGFIFGRG